MSQPGFFSENSEAFTASEFLSLCFVDQYLVQVLHSPLGVQPDNSNTVRPLPPIEDQHHKPPQIDVGGIDIEARAFVVDQVKRSVFAQPLHQLQRRIETA